MPRRIRWEEPKKPKRKPSSLPYGNKVKGPPGPSWRRKIAQDVAQQEAEK